MTMLIIILQQPSPCLIVFLIVMWIRSSSFSTQAETCSRSNIASNLSHLKDCLMKRWDWELSVDSGWSDELVCGRSECCAYSKELSCGVWSECDMTRFSSEPSPSSFRLSHSFFTFFTRCIILQSTFIIYYPSPLLILSIESEKYRQQHFAVLLCSLRAALIL